MPNTPTHQATGLAAHLRHPASRLVAMVNYGAERAELSLLWRLCLAWVELGYPVTVLDAGSRESPDNPGLEQILEFHFTQKYGPQDDSTWRVIPAALGFSGLISAGKSLLDIENVLVNLCPEDGVVVAYATAETLVPLMQGSKTHPILVASPAPDALLASYMALKRLLSVKNLGPLVIDQSTETSVRRANPAKTLADCTKNYLHCDLKVVHLNCAPDDAPPASDMQRLALRVLESAHPLSGRWSTLAHNGTKMGAGQIHRSH